MMIQTEGVRAPLLTVWMTQFEKLIESLEICLTGKKDPEFENAAYGISENLCGASRQILYRINRITVEDLKDLQRMFRDAAKSIERVELSDPKKAALKSSFRDHIIERIELLKDVLIS